MCVGYYASPHDIAAKTSKLTSNQLTAFAVQAIDSRGLYSDSIPEVKDFYQSYSYIDDLAWAAAWLAMRTGEQEDIDSARFYLQQHISEEAGGDRRRSACVVRHMSARDLTV